MGEKLRAFLKLSGILALMGREYQPSDVRDIIMPRNKVCCPACGAYALNCVKTMADESEPLHVCELPRMSVWMCGACKARFMLHTPAGKMTRVKERCMDGHA